MCREELLLSDEDAAHGSEQRGHGEFNTMVMDFSGAMTVELVAYSEAQVSYLHEERVYTGRHIHAISLHYFTDDKISSVDQVEP